MAEKEWRSHVNLPNDYFYVLSSHSNFEFYNTDAEFYWNRQFICREFLQYYEIDNNSNALHDKSVSALLKANSWLKNQGVTAGNVKIPENLLKLAKVNKSVINLAKIGYFWQRHRLQADFLSGSTVPKDEASFDNAHKE
ncbi:hypothetical protein OUZ56_018589 [Daphnia magna]|uniref:Uncharacterized protein n=1 Tax=Daphnia magna TaxID=35525 RepID=A0ABQ9Z9B6_9CRUS|nr:hypothetical protein OUZ56_018589 [Daphnia magna]